MYKMLFLFGYLLFCNQVYCADFKFQFLPDKTVIKFADRNQKSDKKETITFRNRTKLKIVLQIIRGRKVIKGVNVDPGRTRAISINKSGKQSTAVRMVQPAADLIELKYIGRQVEIP